MDLQFLFVPLRRLRRTTELASHVSASKKQLAIALEKFDSALPTLSMIRNVGEHIDAYAVNSGKRHHKEIDRRSPQASSWDGTTYEWLAVKLI
jgi:hypothetical protein